MSGGPTREQLLEKRRMSPGIYADLCHRYRNGTDADLEALGEIYRLNRAGWEKGGADEWGYLVNLKPALMREWRAKWGGKGGTA